MVEPRAVAILSEVRPPELHQTRARRRQLFGLTLVVFVVVAAWPSSPRSATWSSTIY